MTSRVRVTHRGLTLAGAAAVLGCGGATSGGPATVDQESGGNELAVDQLSQTSESTPDDGPIGLLALTATVCVVGVSAGAVRALISQRANRAEWA
jgi:hypothetical protein